MEIADDHRACRCTSDHTGAQAAKNVTGGTSGGRQPPWADSTESCRATCTRPRRQNALEVQPRTNLGAANYAAMLTMTQRMHIQLRCSAAATWLTEVQPRDRLWHSTGACSHRASTAN